MSIDRPESSNHPRLLFSVDGTRYEIVRRLGQRSNGELMLARRRYAYAAYTGALIFILAFRNVWW